MNFFSDDRAGELRDLFFESATELLQALNEEGLLLEKHPSDADIIRSIRRTVHTLKGDSAACGFRELSELAHAVEDVLTPELATRDAAGVAQLVLTAADVFDSMLSAYRSNVQPPSGDALRSLISKLQRGPSAEAIAAFEPAFAWTEYERLVIANSAATDPLFNVALRIDPQCPMRSAALQLISNVLREAGVPLVTHPEDLAGEADCVEAALASSRTAEWIAAKCKIPSVVSDVVVVPYADPVTASTDADPLLLDLVTDPAPAVRERADLAGPLLNVDIERPSTSKEQPATETPAPTSLVQSTPVASENILRVDAERIDSVLDLVGEMIIAKSMLQQTIQEFNRRYPKDPLRGKFADMLAYQAQVLNELQRSVMKVRMVPVEQLFRRFPRVVRDVSKLEGKAVELVMRGVETDLDKSILDGLAEPLTHLVRNAVDHGIESPMQRLSAGKPAQGTITLDAYHQGSNVVIEISDDGRGIDPQKVMARAIERGVITAEQASHMTDAEIVELIFEAGFSTADKVTEISGRGIGMDVVKTVLERMKGTVSVRSELGSGTRFLLKVPLTLAIIRALLLRAGNRIYAVPLGSVVEILRAHEREIHRVDGNEVLQVRDEVLTLARVARIAGGETSTNNGKLYVVVIAIGDRKFGLIVDRLLGEEEIVIKALDDHLVATDLVSGASILGDGTVVLILNVTAVIDRLGRARAGSVATTVSVASVGDKKLGASA